VNANSKIFFPHFDELLSERHPDGSIPQNVGVLHELLPERRAGRPSRKSEPLTIVSRCLISRILPVQHQ
jgi:hypothetical protein